MAEPPQAAPPATRPAPGASPPGLAIGILAAVAALDLVRGSIHLLASDGGAGRIAGIDLSANGEVIVFLFAALGLQQLAFAGVELAVVLRWRQLTAPLLALLTGKQLLSVVVLWLYKPLPVPAPGKYGALVLLPVLALGCGAALRGARKEDGR